MKQADIETIRSRAHALWEEAGRPEGQAATHWLAAEREILSLDLGADTEGEDGNGVIVAGPQASTLADPASRRPARK
jgi:hypothetical protein